MTDRKVLVVGAGLAGLAAATELARAGLSVLVVDQAQAVGGAIHRQPLPGMPSVATQAQARRWAGVMAGVAAQGGRITLALGTRFGGVDHTGMALLTGAQAALFRPLAVVLALGAREHVQPRPGWTLPGVQTAGAIQTAIKSGAGLPGGRVLLAGSGPLLLALGAELCRMGRPPIAIIEAARPLRPVAALGLPPSYMVEATGYLLRLWRHGVPLLWGAHLTGIDAVPNGLAAIVATSAGPRRYTADVIGLHDGIRPNDGGLPDCTALPVIRLGDCREALGARAALADGRAGGAALAAQLTGQSVASVDDAALVRQRRAQSRLARIYAHDGLSRLVDLPDDTVICRCENRTVADLKALGPAPTQRQLRLDGRFAMGACQGRFCAHWVGHLAHPEAPMSRLGAPRWPVVPLSVADFLAADPEPDDI
jgi:D-hydroxyproline dehydrogenase subunit alpha